MLSSIRSVPHVALDMPDAMAMQKYERKGANALLARRYAQLSSRLVQRSSMRTCLLRASMRQ